jgi:signal transduction histidine kinase
VSVARTGSGDPVFSHLNDPLAQIPIVPPGRRDHNFVGSMPTSEGVDHMATGPHETLPVARAVADDSWPELVCRAAAIAHATRRRKDDLRLPDELARQIQTAERRTLALARAGGGELSRRAAALEFLAAVVTAFRLAGASERGDARSLVSDAAAAIGVSRGAANLLVFMRAVAAPDVARLAPESAIDHVLDLLVELGPAEGVSLWRLSAPGRLECLAGAGEAATTRRLRGAARELLEGGRQAPARSASHVRAVPVERWDSRFAALVGRARPEATARLVAYLGEAAAALSPVFEREMLFERNAVREHVLASASERWGARLGCDLHDGPLQEIVALAEDLRLVRRQVVPRVDGSDGTRIAGRFDDLEARLASLDRSLRDISHAVRPTTALEQPLEHALRNEVEVFGRGGTIAAGFAATGDFSTLTASQRIVLFRVVQEALANTRKHSEATRVDVRLKAKRGYVSVSVSDDGCGFDPEQARRKGRLGLSGVIERVRLLGGDIEIRSDPGRGTRIRATLPRWTKHGKPEKSAAYAVAP